MSADDLDRWPDPPEPSERRWAEVYARIAAGLPRRRGRWWLAVPAGVIGATVGVVGWFAWPATAVPSLPSVVEGKPDPLAEYDVLPVATEGDVMVSAVRGGGVGFGSISHPVPGTMPLVGADDVTVLSGPGVGELSRPEPGDAPVWVWTER